MMTFQSASQPGALGKSFSFLRVDNNHVFVAAVKKAEESSDVIVRVVEMRGEAVPNLHLAFAGPVIAAREVNGQELPQGGATVTKGEIETSLGPYAIRTLAVKLAAPAQTLPPTRSVPVDLKYDLVAASDDSIPSKIGFDAVGENLPAEMLPTSLPMAGSSSIWDRRGKIIPTL
jgi:alpha-mannosidase